MNSTISFRTNITSRNIKCSTRAQLLMKMLKCLEIHQRPTLESFPAHPLSSPTHEMHAGNLRRLLLEIRAENHNWNQQCAFIHWIQQLPLLLQCCILASIFFFEICLFRSPLRAFTFLTYSFDTPCKPCFKTKFWGIQNEIFYLVYQNRKVIIYQVRYKHIPMYTDFNYRHDVI